MNEALRKKYIPMTETTYYTLLSVKVPRHGYAIIQYVSSLTKGRIVLGTGTLYTMVGRLVADGILAAIPLEGKKVYRITPTGTELLREETMRLERQLEDGKNVLGADFTAEGLTAAEYSAFPGEPESGKTAGQESGYTAGPFMENRGGI